MTKRELRDAIAVTRVRIERFELHLKELAVLARGDGPVTWLAERAVHDALMSYYEVDDALQELTRRERDRDNENYYNIDITACDPERPERPEPKRGRSASVTAVTVLPVRRIGREQLLLGHDEGR
jgi:hypothetical protein